MDPDPILAMPSSSCVCFHNLLMRPSFKLDWRCSDFDPTHRDVTRLFKWNEGRSVCFSMLRLSWWPTSNASNANRRRVQVGWALGNLRLWEVGLITGKVVNWDFTDQEKSERRAEKRYFEKWVYSGRTYRCPHWKADAATSAPVTVQTYDSPLLNNC